MLGLALLAAGVFLWQYYARHGFTDQLLQKMPRDAYLAGISRWDRTTPATIRQVSQAANVYAASTPPVLESLAVGTDLTKVGDVLGEQYAFAATGRGNVLIGTVRRPSRYEAFQSALAQRLDGQKTTDVDNVRVTTGTLKGTSVGLAVAREGNYVYVASNPELITAARRESDGFTNLDKFSEVAASLPATGDGLLFYNLNPVREKVGFDVSLVGAAYRDTTRHLELEVARANPSVITTKLKRTDGKLLPPGEQILGGIEGVNVLDYLHLLEEQRQEDDVPKVLALQNAITSVSRAFGTDFEKTYLASPSEHFAYIRHAHPTGPQWAMALEFPDAATAQAKTADLKAKVSEKLTVPVRKQVVTVLPDGSQSREVVGEGREPVAFTDEEIGGRPGFSLRVPGSIGTVHALQWDRYLIFGSTVEGPALFLSNLGRPARVGSHGELAIRVKVTEAQNVFQRPDLLSEWIQATKPSRAQLRLDKESGVLEGTVTFSHPS